MALLAHSRLALALWGFSRPLGFFRELLEPILCIGFFLFAAHKKTRLGMAGF
jgi:hypothetical protein